MSAKPSSIEEAIHRYGPLERNVLGAPIWKNVDDWCVIVAPPAGLAWINAITKKPVQHIYVNKDMAPVLLRALQNIITRGLVKELKTFDGCYEPRDVRGMPGKISCHAYAMAIDINAAENPLGAEPMLSEELVECFTDVGFDWGGNFERRDAMHLSFAWEGK